MRRHIHLTIDDEKFHVSINKNIIEIRYGERAGVKTMLTWKDVIKKADWSDYAPCRQPKVYRLKNS
ncbi:MAG: hypothetical protein ABIA04_13940 [Pseudomonadota bacterium]